MTTKVCCGTCALWDRDAAKDKAGRVCAYLAADCLWPSPVAWPALAYRPGTHIILRMFRDEGTDCACWRPREDRP